MTTSELQLAKAFRDAGIEQAKAEALSLTIFDAIRDAVATKSDLRTTEQSLRSDLKLTEQALQRDLKLTEQSLRSDLKVTEQALQSDMQALRSDLKLTEQSLQRDLRLTEQSLKLWMGGIAFAGLSALFVALHYWPPHP